MVIGENNMTSNLEVVVGTYEQFLLGYTIDDVVNKYKMEQSFATHSHLASIRSVSSNKHYLASSAADDTVCLYDMRNRTESGKLVHHNDTVNSISFTPDASHLITASSDGTIGVVRCGNWQLEKHWLKAHKGFAVDTLAIHPTGKIAMTTGHDGVLRTWNLVKGRQAYATNLVPRWKIDAKNISVLKWSPSGNSYLLAANNRVDIYSVETAGIEEELTFDSKVVCVEYLNDEYIAVGLTDGKISIYNLEGSKSEEIEAHDARVKCLSVKEDLLVSASSSGEIKLWKFKKGNLTLLNKVNCSARISCLTLTSCQRVNYKKDEIDLEVIVPEKPTNKLRLKQQVIIEDEGNDVVKTKKSKSNKKKARKLDEVNIDSENTSKTKKIKTNISTESLPKKHKSDTSDLPTESLKKKKKLSQTKKRKEISELTDNIVEDSIKKKKTVQTKIDKVKNEQENKKQKKRKPVPEETIGSLPKKQKTVGYSLLKKKKKKSLKNKISR